jgi:hypothetical protein
VLAEDFSAVFVGDGDVGLGGVENVTPIFCCVMSEDNVVAGFQDDI